jgi:hypothetical protein
MKIWNCGHYTEEGAGDRCIDCIRDNIELKPSGMDNTHLVRSADKKLRNKRKKRR